MDIESIVVKANVGDTVVAKEDFDWSIGQGIKEGEEWEVVDKADMFINIVRDDVRLWLGKNSFVRVFEDVAE